MTLFKRKKKIQHSQCKIHNVWHPHKITKCAKTGKCISSSGEISVNRIKLEIIDNEIGR